METIQGVASSEIQAEVLIIQETIQEEALTTQETIQEEVLTVQETILVEVLTIQEIILVEARSIQDIIQVEARTIQDIIQVEVLTIQAVVPTILDAILVAVLTIQEIILVEARTILAATFPIGLNVQLGMTHPIDLITYCLIIGGNTSTLIVLQEVQACPMIATIIPIVIGTVMIMITITFSVKAIIPLQRPDLHTTAIHLNDETNEESHHVHQ